MNAPTYLAPLLFVIIFGGALAVPALMTVRNVWVYRERVRLLYADLAAYRRLPSYNTMMRKFWIWKIERFLP